jgi:hypothetical protein
MAAPGHMGQHFDTEEEAAAYQAKVEKNSTR